MFSKLFGYIFFLSTLMITTCTANAQDVHPRYQKLLECILEFAQQTPAIKAVALVGSQARKDHPADAFSDLNLCIITDQPETLKNPIWIDQIEPPILAYAATTNVDNHLAWRILFSDGLDVNFSIIPSQEIKFLLSDHTHELIDQGYRFLMDKENYQAVLDQLEAVYQSIPYIPALPSKEAYYKAVHEFWYKALWAAKRLARDECLAAHNNGLISMRSCLLKMIQWHAQLKNQHFSAVWQYGRFVKEWMEPDILAEFNNTFTQLSNEELKQALTSAMQLFERLSLEVATELQFDSPASISQDVRTQIQEL